MVNHWGPGHPSFGILFLELTFLVPVHKWHLPVFSLPEYITAWNSGGVQKKKNVCHGISERTALDTLLILALVVSSHGPLSLIQFRALQIISCTSYIVLGHHYWCSHCNIRKSCHNKDRQPSDHNMKTPLKTARQFWCAFLCFPHSFLFDVVLPGCCLFFWILFFCFSSMFLVSMRSLLKK